MVRGRWSRGCLILRWWRWLLLLPGIRSDMPWVGVAPNGLFVCWIFAPLNARERAPRVAATQSAGHVSRMVFQDVSKAAQRKLKSVELFFRRRDSSLEGL